MTYGQCLINSVGLADLEMAFVSFKLLLVHFYEGWFSSECVLINKERTLFTWASIMYWLPGHVHLILALSCPVCYK